MANKYRISNYGASVLGFGSELVQPMTTRVLAFEDSFTESQIQRHRDSGVLIKSSKEEAENGGPLPAPDPDMVALYTRMISGEGDDAFNARVEAGLMDPLPKTTSKVIPSSVMTGSPTAQIASADVSSATVASTAKSTPAPSTSRTAG